MQGNKQHNIEITPTKIKERIRKMANWKTPGPDGAMAIGSRFLCQCKKE